MSDDREKLYCSQAFIIEKGGYYSSKKIVCARNAQECRDKLTYSLRDAGFNSDPSKMRIVELKAMIGLPLETRLKILGEVMPIIR